MIFSCISIDRRSICVRAARSIASMRDSATRRSSLRRSLNAFCPRPCHPNDKPGRHSFGMPNSAQRSGDLGLSLFDDLIGFVVRSLPCSISVKLINGGELLLEVREQFGGPLLRYAPLVLLAAPDDETSSFRSLAAICGTTALTDSPPADLVAMPNFGRCFAGGGTRMRPRPIPRGWASWIFQRVRVVLSCVSSIDPLAGGLIGSKERVEICAGSGSCPDSAFLFLRWGKSRCAVRAEFALLAVRAARMPMDPHV